MEKLTPEEIVVLGTTIALELAKGKTKDEIKAIRFLVSQIFYSLTTLYYWNVVDFLIFVCYNLFWRNFRFINYFCYLKGFSFYDVQKLYEIAC